MKDKKKKEEKPKEEPFIIEGFIDDHKIFWKKNIPCICNGINDLKNCKRCRYQHQENCVPRKPFIHLGKTITKITVMRGSDGDLYAIKY